MAEDWKSIHLSWIKSHQNFVPKYAYDYTVPYYDIMHQVYQNPNCTQAWAENCYLRDVEWDEKSKLLKKKVKDQVLKGISMPCSTHFITIGFNHQTWNKHKCVELINHILSFTWIEKATAVFELYRENGEHPHCHILLESSLPKSTIINKIWAAKGIKRIVLQKSFIDYKVALPVHTEYVKGNKQEAKLPYVEMDREWREKNDIPHNFIK